MSISVHVLEADPALEPHASALAAAAGEALDRIGRRMPVSDVDVVIARNTAAVIPELGIGGFSPSAHLIYVSVDPEHAAFQQVIDVHLSRTLAHELHHCMRWRGPGYGNTLGEALVSEGLADHFDLEVHPASQPYHWTRALDADGLAATWQRARSVLWEEGYDHGYWFFNRADGGPPFHAGYALGFSLVRAYLRANPGLEPSGLAGTPAQQILSRP